MARLTQNLKESEFLSVCVAISPSNGYQIRLHAMSALRTATHRLAEASISKLSQTSTRRLSGCFATNPRLPSGGSPRRQALLSVGLEYRPTAVTNVGNVRVVGVNIRALSSPSSSSIVRAAASHSFPAAAIGSLLARRTLNESNHHGGGRGHGGRNNGWEGDNHGRHGDRQQRPETVAAAFGAMVVVSVQHTLGNTFSAQCQAKPRLTKHEVTAQTEQVVSEPVPVSLYELFAILEGEWVWLAGAIVITFGFTFVSLNLPAAFSAVMAACREHKVLGEIVIHLAIPRVLSLISLRSCQNAPDLRRAPAPAP